MQDHPVSILNGDQFFGESIPHFHFVYNLFNIYWWHLVVWIWFTGYCKSTSEWVQRPWHYFWLNHSPGKSLKQKLKIKLGYGLLVTEKALPSEFKGHGAIFGKITHPENPPKILIERCYGSLGTVKALPSEFKGCDAIFGKTNHPENPSEILIEPWYGSTGIVKALLSEFKGPEAIFG